MSTQETKILRFDEIAERVYRINERLWAEEPSSLSKAEKGKRKYTGYQAQFIIDAVNEILGYINWRYDLLDIRIEKPENAGQWHAEAKIKLYIIYVCPKATSDGANFLVEQEFCRGEVVGSSANPDYGSTLKGAITDALKKALSQWSIGQRAYRDEIENGNATGPPKALPDQVKRIHELGLAMENWTKGDLIKLASAIARRQINKSDELTRSEAAELIRRLEESKPDEKATEEKPDEELEGPPAVSQDQITEIERLRVELGLYGKDIKKISLDNYGKPVLKLTHGEATDLILKLEEMVEEKRDGKSDGQNG